mgnify:CR=1 FL=1
MKLSEYANFDGVGLAKLVGTGEVSPKELATCASLAIAKINPDINAVVELYPDRIESLDESELGNGPFKGVPFLIKDIGNLEAGRKCEQGSRLLEGFVAQEDSYLIKLLRASGVNNIGRSNVPEFCIASTTENALYGDTSTPWRKGNSAGGSSGGAAAAVASGMVPIAHGSDIGGSIRIPAAHCGVIGLKPSRGRITYGPQADEKGFGMAANMVQTRTVRDTAAMLDCLSIPQPGDPFVIRQPSRPYIEEVGAPFKKLKIAYSTDPLMSGTSVHPEIADAIEKTATLLESMGHEVERAKPNYHPEDALIHCPNLWFLGFDKYIDALASATNRPINLDTLEPCTLDLYQKAKDIDPFTIFDSFDWVNRVRREFGKHFAQYDIWLTPTTVMPSEPLGRYNQSLTGLSTEEYFYLSETPVQYCAAYNITGLPAISLPLHQTSDGLPIGVQLGARHGEEELLINVSSALEQALPWANNTPEFHASKY